MKANNPTCPSLRVAVTGGIACGKSEVGRVLAAEGARVLEADDIAREVLRAGAPAFDAVVREFGSDVVGPDGEIDRLRLGRLVFGNAEKRAVLNALTHPEIMRMLEAGLKAARREGLDTVAIVPLLFEIGAEKGWDAVIGVTASERTVLERLQARGLSDDEARARMAAQWPTEEKMRRSDWIVENNGSRRELADEIRRVWRAILKEKEKVHHGRIKSPEGQT